MKLRDLERHLTSHGARKVGEGARHTKWRTEDGRLAEPSQGVETQGRGATLGRPADVAQLVEHFTRNEGVGSSSLPVGSKETLQTARFFIELILWSKLHPRTM